MFLSIIRAMQRNIFNIEYADIAQQVERILGKDEVPGSNPGISSRQTPPRDNSQGRFFFV